MPRLYPARNLARIQANGRISHMRILLLAAATLLLASYASANPRWNDAALRAIGDETLDRCVGVLSRIMVNIFLGHIQAQKTKRVFVFLMI
jgi:hypothetical protein